LPAPFHASGGRGLVSAHAGRFVEGDAQSGGTIGTFGTIGVIGTWHLSAI
jgi:hypothetical protein